MDMTFQDYINNPMGRKNAVISNREMYRSFYMNKFNALMLRENGKFDYNLYRNGDDYIIHIKIPSETVKNFYYDVVIHFSPNSIGSKASTTIEDYNVKFYSNDPAFVYTFAHAFIKNGVFFSDLKDKMSKEAIKKEAKDKNPKNEVGYVKTIYIAYLYMKNKGLFRKIQYVSAPKYNKKQLLSSVMSADEKISLRQEEGEKQKQESKRSTKKKPSTSTDTSTGNAGAKTSFIKSTKRVSDTKKSSIIKTSKRTKRV